MLLEDPRARRIVDLVRAVGILLVIFFHVLYGLARLLPDAARLRFTVEFPNALAIGWQALGSELIFLFSGFLVSYVLIVEHREAGRIAYGPYLWRRAARILPLYYAALAFYTLTLQPEVWDIAASAVLLGFILRDENVIPVGWSMEAMVQVYIVLPLLVRYILRGRSGLRILGLIAASVLARVLYVALSPDTFETFYIGAIETTKFSDAARELYFMAWFRATPFLIGLGLAWLVLTHHDRLRDRLSEPRLWLPALALGLSTAGAIGWVPVQNAEAWIYAVAGEPFWRVFWALHRFVFASGAALLVLALFYAPPFRSPWLLRALDLGPWRLIARNIYGIYLFHFLFVLVAAVIVFQSTDEAVLANTTIWHVLGVWLVASALSTGAAILLRRFIEVPAAKWVMNRAPVPR